MGIFSKNHVPDPNVKRNTFDLSFQSNLTMKMGTLYPCFCKEVLPGDTFKIDTAFGLRFMPLVFPIQTKMRADVHYFYVRNRNLWDEWPNFIGDHTNKSEMPCIVNTRNQFKTGSLGDYLGLPSTYVGTEAINSEICYASKHHRHMAFSVTDFYNDTDVLFIEDWYLQHGVLDIVSAFNSENKVNGHKLRLDSTDMLAYSFRCSRDSIKAGESFFISGNMGEALAKLFASKSKDIYWFLVPDKSSLDDTYRDNLTEGTATNWYHKTYGSFIQGLNPFDRGVFSHNGDEDFTIEFTANKDFNLSDYTKAKTLTLICFTSEVFKEDRNTFSYVLSGDDDLYPWGKLKVSLNSLYCHSDVLQEFDGSFNYPISALPFRAYESIYNAFYRDQRNNPYYVDGELKINQYIPSLRGGQDSHDYVLRHRNWEQDFLTSALPSPQMGAAPLVGLTSSGVATYQADDGTLYKVKLSVADDGDTITGAEYTSNIPNEVARSIVNISSSGISINDLRAVNSLQRWLEANFRKGLKYKDQIASHFGVNTSYAELDMPEFLGGCSQMVDIQQINQTSEGSDDSPLGSYAGQASVVGGSNNTIQHYCDEHGFIIGIISVVPVPCYSQLLPKHFTKMDTLDYYFPEFGHIGMQPIPYREVCPLQCIKDGHSLDNTFGYQRAWYDYLASTDEVHGDFRTTLRDFLLQRDFKNLPSLNSEFLTVDEEDLNNVFAVNEGDHILGQVHFKVLAKRPIPRYGIPRLE